ncbi:hypothetical protein [Jannaschia marina]|uniref:hypothetical protein n=1 Tax=Jannaschia marina TaxID=2741674 RepID=UPI0015C9B7BB|nr:hypothetical protein [Jannaschia marina]
MPQTTPWILHRVSVTGGTYQGLLVATNGGGEPPELSLHLGDARLGPLQAEAVEGGFRVSGEMGVAPLTEGTQTVAVRTDDGQLLDSVTVVTGLGAPDDLRAEIDTLAAELDMLKAAFRRYVAERD